MRRTQRLVDVAVALLDDPHGQHWGYELSRASRVRSGILYPILTRLLDAGWVTDGWESQTEAKGRPARRYYRLTDLGRRELGAVVAAANSVPSAPRSTLGSPSPRAAWMIS